MRKVQIPHNSGSITFPIQRVDIYRLVCYNYKSREIHFKSKFAEEKTMIDFQLLGTIQENVQGEKNIRAIKDIFW